MAELDPLREFDWGTVTKTGLYLKFEAGKPVTLRVLTTDPVVFDNVYEDKKTGEQTITTKFAFVVYNFTDEKAQILQASPNMARKIGELHVDPDFGANIKKVDIKISPTGEKLERRYDIQVLPKAHEMTTAQIKECQAINLDEKVEGDRMSVYNPADYQPSEEASQAIADEAEVRPEDIGDEPINLDDIPF